MMTVGTRLRTTAVIDIFPLGVWPIGTTGTVLAIEPDISGQSLATVRLDQHYPALDYWDNCLQVWEHQCWDNGNSDAVMASFEAIGEEG